MDNEKLRQYRRDLRANKPIEELLKDTNSLLQRVQVVQKKAAYVPPYARCKLSCIFHNGWKKNFFSYDYDPRENLEGEDPERYLDEGRGLRALMELATKYHNKNRLNYATLFVNLKDIPYTGSVDYNFQLARWGSRVDTIKRPWKLLTYDNPPLQEKPVYAKTQAILDLADLRDQDLEFADAKERRENIAIWNDILHS